MINITKRGTLGLSSTSELDTKNKKEKPSLFKKEIMKTMEFKNDNSTTFDNSTKLFTSEISYHEKRLNIANNQQTTIDKIANPFTLNEPIKVRARPRSRTSKKSPLVRTTRDRKSSLIKANLKLMEDHEILARRRDHICDLRESEMNKYALYSQKAEEFFLVSDAELFLEMPVVVQRHIRANLIPEWSRRDSGVSRAKQIRFSSFNRMKIDKIAGIGAQISEGDIKMMGGTFSSQSGDISSKDLTGDFKKLKKMKLNDSTSKKPKNIKNNQETQRQRRIPDKSDTEKNSTHRTLHPKLDFRPRLKRPIQCLRTRSKSAPVEKSILLVYQKKMLEMLVEEVYKDKLVPNIRKSKTFFDAKEQRRREGMRAIYNFEKSLFHTEQLEELNENEEIQDTAQISGTNNRPAKIISEEEVGLPPHLLKMLGENPMLKEGDPDEMLDISSEHFGNNSVKSFSIGMIGSQRSFEYQSKDIKAVQSMIGQNQNSKNQTPNSKHNSAKKKNNISSLTNMKSKNNLTQSNVYIKKIYNTGNSKKSLQPNMDSDKWSTSRFDNRSNYIKRKASERLSINQKLNVEFKSSWAELQADEILKHKKRVNFSKRFFKCKEFTRKCEMSFKKYKEQLKKFEKSELQRYKRILNDLKKKGKIGTKGKNSIGLFDVPFEKKFNFVYRMQNCF